MGNGSMWDAKISDEGVRKHHITHALLLALSFILEWEAVVTIHWHTNKNTGRGKDVCQCLCQVDSNVGVVAQKVVGQGPPGNNIMHINIRIIAIVVQACWNGSQNYEHKKNSTGNLE